MTDEQKQESKQEEQTDQVAVEETTEEESLDAVTEEEEVRVEPEEEEVASFTGDVGDDETFTYDQLQAASEDYTDEEFHQLEDMYEGTLNEIEEKEIVTGRVVSADQDYVVVDIGFKS